MTGSAFGVLCMLPTAALLSSAEAQTRAGQPEQVVITGAKEDYKVDEPSLPKLLVPLIDVPQTIDTISEQELKDRAITTFNDALRTVPGITLGAGEFRSMGNTPSIRGFVARTDIFLDGLRDFGDYYRDPFDLQEIEVLKGPSSILFGRGSTGGVINQVTKHPGLDGFITGAATVGSDLTRRAVVDIDGPLPDLGNNAAFRINVMGDEARVTGRNAVQNSRYGFAPSLALGLGTPTRVTVDYFHLTTDDVPDYGLPYFGSKPAQVPHQNFYGFKSDYMKMDTDVGTVTVEHDYGDGITVRNQLRYANYNRNFRFTEPLIAANVPLNTPLSAVNVTRNVNAGNSQDSMFWDQADATFRFDTGFLAHALVAGIEGGRERATPEFINNTGVPTTPLLTPNPDMPFTATSTFPRFKTDTSADSFAVYALDTVKLGDQWELSGGFRWDYFGLIYNAWNYSTVTPGLITRMDRIPRIDRMPSYRGSLVYKPETNGSVYFSYGTSFNPSGEELSLVTSSRSFTSSNAFLAPEKNHSIELGTKWDLLGNNLSLTGAVFRLVKENARVPDPTNAALNVLAGTQRVDGFEIAAVGRITENWQISGGYTYLDSQTTKTLPGGPPVGSPLMNTPRNNLTFWSTYALGGGFEVGAGGRYLSSQVTQNVPPTKSVPGFFVADVMGKYTISERLSLQLNVNNVFDKFYYDQLHFFHVVPGEGRTALLTLNFSY
jgi:catecholate siderophore receptor